MTTGQLWQQYISICPQATGQPYEAWCFGSDNPDLLAQLTCNGTKTATAPAYPFYLYEDCSLPQPGNYSVILATGGEALCIIKTTQVNVVPFCEVSEEQAYKEGEGDRSLAYWREVHRAVFTEELKEIGEIFSEEMLVVCEEFEVAFLPRL